MLFVCGYIVLFGKGGVGCFGGCVDVFGGVVCYVVDYRFIDR